MISKEVKRKKRNLLQVSKALTTIRIHLGERAERILQYSEYYPIDGWRRWLSPWGGMLVMEDKVLYSPAPNLGDLFISAASDIVGRWSEKEMYDGGEWYWGEDQLLRVWKDGERIDPIGRYMVRYP